MSPRPATVDVEVSRKRKDRDTEDSVLLSPGTPGSNSSFLMTPKFEAKKISMIDHLALKEENTIKDLGPGPLASIEGEEPFPWYKSTYDVSNFPSAGAQNPITVFPVSYQTYQQPNTQNNNTAQQGQTSQGNETPNTLAAQQNNANSVQLDPTLSSIRSSVIPNSNGDQNPLIDPTLSTPEIRFPDAETLASATASPGRDGIPGDASTQAALAAVGGTPTLTAEDAAALLAPPQDSDTPIKKEQPFSRSPELRVSHKLAERKRRKEMKELFDELRDELPSDRGMKASKWEILSKAIDHVRQLKASQEQMVREIDHLRREVDIARGGTGAYTHAYNTYNLTGTYPPQNTFSNTSTPAAQNTAQQSQQQVQQPQQTTQQLAQPQQQIQQQVQPQQQTQQIQQPVQQQQTQQVESTDIQVDPTPVAQ
nr:uncharacterized protein I206_00162 [Kwoniella pini CBS 10737]OCF52862.1 hypothetical protein I206_00162 [Kwoniella pini CBS 10737]